MAQHGSIDFSTLLGKTIVEIRVERTIDSEHTVKRFIGKSFGIEFVCNDGTAYVQAHDQDCCEVVFIEDIIGDLNDLIGSPLVMAEEVSNDDIKDSPDYPLDYDWGEWTFYKLATKHGYVTIRWFGTSSSGYYSNECGLWEVGSQGFWVEWKHLEKSESRGIEIYTAGGCLFN